MPVWYYVPVVAFRTSELSWLLEVGLSKPSLICQRSPAVVGQASVVTSTDWKTGSRPVRIQDWGGQGSVWGWLVMGQARPGRTELSTEALGGWACCLRKSQQKAVRWGPGRDEWVVAERDTVCSGNGDVGQDARTGIQHLERNALQTHWVKTIPLLIGPARKCQYFMFLHSGI